MSKCHRNDSLGFGCTYLCPVLRVAVDGRPGLGLYINFFFKAYIRMLEVIDWKEACDIHVMLCCLFVCECRKSAVLSMELSSYDLLPPEQCLCVSMGAEHSCWSREYRQAMAGSPIPWPLSQGSRPGMCSSPTGSCKAGIVHGHLA